MNYHQFEIVLQEVPGEISLCFTITGCSLQCEGCHSPFLWKTENGMLLSVKEFEKKLNQYLGFASCVLFMGGEWHEENLVELLKIAHQKNYKTCLYTGQNSVSQSLLKELTWLKTGKWIPQNGGLNNPKTNQKFIHVKTNTTLNHLFLKTNSNDSIN